MSSFREAIFIDADALFLQNPEILFEDSDYLKTGALFYKDRLIMPESKRKWLRKILPKPISEQVKESRLWTGASGHMQESGVIVLDKWRHFVSLLLITRLNGPHRTGNEEMGIQGVYDMMHGKSQGLLELSVDLLLISVGDKETFWIGFELAGDLDYAFADGAVGTMTAGKDVTGSENYTVCERQLLHVDGKGRPVWFNGGLKPRNATSGPPNFEVFALEPDASFSGDPWEVQDDNVVCLTTQEYYALESEDLNVLGMIAEVATSAEISHST